MNKILDNRNIFVIGYMGSDRRDAAKKIAVELQYELLDMDAEIERRDGRSIIRMCMIMGEHEYRNKEYELLKELLPGKRQVVICGDGILLDDMNFEALKLSFNRNHDSVILIEAPIDLLWQNAKNDETIPYAFMHISGEDGSAAEVERQKKFYDLYEVRKSRYNEFKSAVDFTKSKIWEILA